jgi:hypothetical protein
MAETFTALLFAHVLADFVLQTKWMVARKGQARVLALHGGIVLATAIAALGTWHLGLLWLAVLHIGIDLLKTRLPHRLWPFLADQAAHLAAIFALSLWLPGLMAQGIWANLPALPALMALLAGGIVATRAGGFAVGLLMAPFADATPDGLPGGGRVIGLLERGLIFVLVLLGQPEGVGLLLAAKSILRFGAVKDDRAASEYVIIGTLASVGWALLAGYATQMLLTALPPLGIFPATP